jgi:hypothetical protein
MKKKKRKKEFSIGSDVSCSHVFDQKLIFGHLNSSIHDKLELLWGASCSSMSDLPLE